MLSGVPEEMSGGQNRPQHIKGTRTVETVGSNRCIVEMV